MLLNIIGPIWNRALAKQEAGADVTCETIETIKQIFGVRWLVYHLSYSLFMIVGSIADDAF